MMAPEPDAWRRFDFTSVSTLLPTDLDLNSLNWRFVLIFGLEYVDVFAARSTDFSSSVFISCSSLSYTLTNPYERPRVISTSLTILRPCFAAWPASSRLHDYYVPTFALSPIVNAIRRHL
jgi:hypothetical protein